MVFEFRKLFQRSPGTVQFDLERFVMKTLARYPHPFFAYREMLQNFNDAKATEVEIRFTSDSPQAEPQEEIQRTISCTLSHNGTPFTDTDWRRITIIGQGNTNSDKVGEFGVGFYTVFSVTKRPRVTSGGVQLEFFFNHNASKLRTRKTKRSSDIDPKGRTSFYLPFDKPGLGPLASSTICDFFEFLASSLVFLDHIATITVYRDASQLAVITSPSVTDPPSPYPIPPNVKRQRPNGKLKLERIECRERKTITTEVMTWVYRTRPGKPLPQMNEDQLSDEEVPPTTATDSTLTSDEIIREDVTLQIYSAVASVSPLPPVDNTMAGINGKDLPSHVKLDLIYTSCHGSPPPGGHESLLRNLHVDVASESLSGKIYIGQCTSEASGVGGHIHCSHFRCTTERELLDFGDQSREWNSDLLYIAGCLTRSIYDSEMSKIQNRSAESPEALRLLQFFRFPSSGKSVSSRLKDAFFSCTQNNDDLLVLSSHGIRHVSMVRSRNKTLAKFIDDDHMVTWDSKQPNVLCFPPKTFKNHTYKEVFDILRDKHILSGPQVTECLVWWLKIRGDAGKRYTTDLFKQTARVATVGGPVPLVRIHYFTPIVTQGASLPMDIVQVDLSKLNPEQLAEAFRWTEVPKERLEVIPGSSTNGVHSELDPDISKSSEQHLDPKPSTNSPLLALNPLVVLVDSKLREFIELVRDLHHLQDSIAIDRLDGLCVTQCTSLTVTAHQMPEKTVSVGAEWNGNRQLQIWVTKVYNYSELAACLCELLCKPQHVQLDSLLLTGLFNAHREVEYHVDESPKLVSSSIKVSTDFSQRQVHSSRNNKGWNVSKVIGDVLKFSNPAKSQVSIEIRRDQQTPSKHPEMACANELKIILEYSQELDVYYIPSHLPESTKALEDFKALIDRISSIFNIGNNPSDRKVAHIFHDPRQPELRGLNWKKCVYLNLAHYQKRKLSRFRVVI
ncbi:hypothetical protein C8J56DRAFT_989348 [Mycena floridula]|nr:hypothetical protein C8J56DRAFT_989348 [Mycena floridula]